MAPAGQFEATGGVAYPAGMTDRQSATGLHGTLCWRETDSNHRFRVRGATVLSLRLAQGAVSCLSRHPGPPLSRTASAALRYWNMAR